jgi:hypothetical protein
VGLLGDRLKSLLGGPRSSAEAGLSAHGRAAPGLAARPGRGEVRLSTRPVATETRQSRGLDQFFGSYRDQTGLSILDLGGAHQENINFITSLGHKFYSEDFLRIFEETFGEDIADQSNPGRIDYFLRRSLDYADEQFDGVLAWDALEYMEPALLAATAERLWRILKPKGYLLAIFHPAERKQTVPCYNFRIQDPRTLQVGRHGERAAAQTLFNNRSVEKLFQKFESVKFFLARDSLREVIVRR